MPGICKSPRLIAAILVVTAAAAAQTPGAAKSPVPASATPPAQLQTASAAGPAPAPAAAPNSAATLRPALDQVQSTLGKTHTERWKRGSVRDEAGADIGSIKSDMQSNLPNLIHDADGSPGSLSKMLPVAKHIDALYDVLLRVVEASRISAPDDQAGELRQALNALGSARLAYDDQMQQLAATQEKQIVDLRTTVQKQAAFKCPAPPPEKPCPPPAPAHRPRKKPAPGANPPSTNSTQKPAAGQQTQKPGATSPNQQH